MGSFLAGSYASAAGRLPAGLDVALKRDLGLSPSQYLADAAASAQAVKVVASLKSVGVDVLGSRIDGTQLTVNIASAADAATVQQADAIAVVGAPTLPDFSKTKFTSVTSTTTYGGEAYFYQSPGQTGGMGYRCSIGFNGYSGSTGAPEFATAGHCETAIAPGTPAYFLSQTAPAAAGADPVLGSPLGMAVAGQYGGGDDYGIISSGDAGIAPQNSIATWGGSVGTGASASISTGAPTASGPLGITGETAGIVGATLCKSGSSSGYTCGLITAVDTPVSVSGQTVNAIVATTCLLPGDSGGGAVVGTNAVGIDSGTSSTSATSCTNAVDQDGDPAQYVYFPMVSSAGSYSVSGQQGSNWQLGVTVSTGAPVVATPASGATVTSTTTLTGTLANPVAGSTVLAYLDGATTPSGRASAASGIWSLTLSGLSAGTHTYSLASGLGWSPGPAVTGSFVVSASSVGADSPVGSVENIQPLPNGIGIWGWAFDANTSNPLELDVYVDGHMVLGGFTSIARPDIQSRYGGPADSGYALVAPAGSGSHTICVYGINVGQGSNTQYGCWSVTIGANPIGTVENVQPQIGGIGIWGWAIDPNTADPILINYYVDGQMVLGAGANVSRPDVGSSHVGYGDDHGFGEFIPTSGGKHTICAYAINVGAGSVNTNLGCHTITVGGSPIGAVENGQPEFNAIGVWGWSIDPDTASSVLMNYYVDGHMVLGAGANALRTDIGSSHPGYGDDHGFGVSLPVSSGTHSVCTYAINVGYGSNTLLGCFTTTVSGNPVGALSSVTSEVDPGGSGATGFAVSGFAIDPDTANSVLMNVYLDGKMVSGFGANEAEADLATTYPGFGANHAYSAWMAASAGTHSVCVYAINVGSGSNTEFPCQPVTVAPTG